VRRERALVATWLEKEAAFEIASANNANPRCGAAIGGTIEALAPLVRSGRYLLPEEQPENYPGVAYRDEGAELAREELGAA
jgi:hypothetical protein